VQQRKPGPVFIFAVEFRQPVALTAFMPSFSMYSREHFSKKARNSDDNLPSGQRRSDHSIPAILKQLDPYKVVAPEHFGVRCLVQIDSEVSFAPPTESSITVLD
jgi:hypothetical protein